MYCASTCGFVGKSPIFCDRRATLKPGNRNADSGIGNRNPESEIRNPESGIRNPESGIRNPESGIRNPESGIRNPESGPESGNQRKQVLQLRKNYLA